MALLLIVSIVTGTCGVLLAASSLSRSRREVAAQLAALRPAATDHRSALLSKDLRRRLGGPVLRTVASAAQSLTPRSSRAALDERLQRSGVWMVASHFYAIKGGVAFGGAIFAVLIAAGSRGPGATVGLALLFAGIGFLAPESWLTMRQRARERALDADLPDVLDLLATSVGAGLSFDAAVVRLAERLDGPLVDELQHVLHSIRLGESRRAALLGLSARSASAGVASFSRALVQADELGVSIGNTLVAQASELRVRRQLEAEEKAMRAPIKMLFPTVIFIFPVIGLVVLVPAGMSLLEHLGAIR